MFDLAELEAFLPWQVYLSVGLLGFLALCVLTVRGWIRIARRAQRSREAGRDYLRSIEEVTPLRFALGLLLVLLLVMVTVFSFFLGLYGYVGGR